MPLIAVTASSEREARSYIDSVVCRGGAVRLLIPPAGSNGRRALDGVDGLLLTGGPDIHPSLYGERVDPQAGVETWRAGDRMELPLLREALARDMPVLAICRGMQLLNVSFGGSLIQHLPDHGGHAEGVDGDVGSSSAYHSVFVTPGSKLAAIIGTGGFFRTNSSHHQGLREPQKAPALLASAYAWEDGVVEGLESPSHRWVVGVQCHPEQEKEVPRSFGNLFQAFLERADSDAGSPRGPV